MKIVKIVDSNEWDIASHQALLLASEIQKKKHKVSVICPKGTRLFAECIKNNITVEELGISGRFGLVDRENCDIIHFYNTKDFPNFAYKFYSKKHKLVFSHFDLSEKKKISKIAKFISRFIAPAPTYSENLFECGVPKVKITTVYPCVRLTRWESAMRIKSLMFEKTPYQIVTVSFDKTLKEQETFLKAAKLIAGALDKPFSFVLLGEKNEMIRELARREEISEKVDILGFRDDLPEVMALAHIFIKTNVKPSISLSLIEAQASGVPCVVPRIPGLSDFTVNGKNGILVEPGNPKAYAAAALKILKNPDFMLKLSKFSFDFTANNLACEVARNMLLCVYEDILLV